MAKKVDPLALQPVYQKLTDLIGEEAMLKVFDYYHGSQISLPSHLYNRQTAANRIQQRYNGNNQEELGRYYGYSQRWVMRVLVDYKQRH
ncbi:Mor transcription activator family protein [Lactiplantibacillus carotarum]|uniref:Mor transcription activator family protein n=1 Tax=Lactiplantibacillus carotarum TaxID=2993456 RepID=UPI00298F0E12|nr:Mor transcription activator family protein [Lactiplantibacillus carotarum]